MLTGEKVHLSSRNGASACSEPGNLLPLWLREVYGDVKQMRIAFVMITLSTKWSLISSNEPMFNGKSDVSCFLKKTLMFQF
jgi:hypothetical protein